MENKQKNLIGKMFNLLYDVKSKYGLFGGEKESVLKFMEGKGYKMKINNNDKCVFIKSE